MPFFDHLKEFNMQEHHLPLSEYLVCAGRHRLCPPPSVLAAFPDDEMLKKHIEACPLCRKRLDELDSELLWEHLADLIGGSPKKEHVHPSPGQVWSVSREKNGWAGSMPRYYNAPDVLILKIFPYNVVRVAQVSGFSALATPDDVFLDAERSVFAESWNIYSLPVSWLDRLRFTALPGAVVLTREISRGPMTNLDKSDPRAQFRLLEVRHSMYFSMNAIHEVAELAESTEKSASGGAAPRSVGQLHCSRRPAETQFPEELSYAAANGSQIFQWKNLLFVEEKAGKVTITSHYSKALGVQMVDEQGFLIPVRAPHAGSAARKTGLELPEFASSDSDVASFAVIPPREKLTFRLEGNASPAAIQVFVLKK